MSLKPSYLLRYPNANRGFTLIEILVATSILMVLTFVLLSISGHAGQIWQTGEEGNQHRQRARMALNFLERELSGAMLPIVRTSQNSLQFVINNDVSNNDQTGPDEIFFQAPVADDVSKGKEAAIGYFVAWNGRQSSLYRIYLGASDTRYDEADPVAATADITGGQREEFLFLENVLGLWVTAYNAAGTPVVNWDSRDEQALPVMVKVDLLLIDAKYAQRMNGPLAFTHEAISDSESMLEELPAMIRPGVRLVSMNVRLDHALRGTVPVSSP